MHRGHMYNDKSIVKPRLGLFVGTILTLVGWGIFFFSDSGLVSAHSPFPSYINRIYEIGILVFLLFWGPISVLSFSWEIKYDGEKIKYTKFFRVVTKTFSVSDISSLSLIPATKHKSAKIKIIFCDGFKINVSKIDFGFNNFWKFLGGDEKGLRP